MREQARHTDLSKLEGDPTPRAELSLTFDKIKLRVKGVDRAIGMTLLMLGSAVTACLVGREAHEVGAPLWAVGAAGGLVFVIGMAISWWLVKTTPPAQATPSTNAPSNKAQGKTGRTSKRGTSKRKASKRRRR